MPLSGIARHGTLWRLVYFLLRHGDKEGLCVPQVLEVLGHLKGPLLKAAQLSAMIPNWLPEPYVTGLKTLCYNTKPASWGEISLLLHKNWGKNWEEFFSFFEKIPKAASLGQVHCGKLKIPPCSENLLKSNEKNSIIAKEKKINLFYETPVACKICYPNISKALATDMIYLKILCSVYKMWGGGIHPDSFVKEMAERFQEETDYVKEKRHLEWFYYLFQNHHDIHIPFPYAPLCTTQCLVMTWQKGRPWKELLLQPQDVRNEAGKKLLFAWFYPFFTAGIIHADPHEGNIEWTYEKEVSLYLFDFGCVRRFSSTFVQGIVWLTQGLENNDLQKQRKGFCAMGFAHLPEHLFFMLQQWAQFLLAPFLGKHKKKYKIKNISSSKEGQKLAWNLHLQLRHQDPISIPPELLLFHRVAIVLGAHLTTLESEENWAHEWQLLINNFNTHECQQNQKTLWHLPACLEKDFIKNAQSFSLVPHLVS